MVKFIKAEWGRLTNSPLRQLIYLMVWAVVFGTLVTIYPNNVLRVLAILPYVYLLYFVLKGIAYAWIINPLSKNKYSAMIERELFEDDTLFHSLITYIRKKEIGETITRQELLEEVLNLASVSTLDGYRRELTKAGYLGMIVPGEYVIKRKPDYITTRELRLEANLRSKLESYEKEKNDCL